jgi:hypothetical protein
MIRPPYALKLARTKLRSKRGMLFASISISSLLFAAVVAAIIIFTGAQKSAVDFIEKANNGKYLVQVQAVVPNGGIPGFDTMKLTADNIKEVRAYEANYYAQLKTKYKSLGIEYSEPSASDSLLTPNAYSAPGTPEDLKYRLNFQSPLMNDFEQGKFVEYAKTAKNTLPDLRRTADSYGGSGYYASTVFPVNSIPSQLLITNGKEDFGDTEFKAGNLSTYGYFINAVHNSQYGFQDKSLLGRYQTFADADKPKGIPVIISAQEAAALFGKQFEIGGEPKQDSAKVSWLKQIQQKITGQTYQTCYRNETEQKLLQKIQQDYADMQNHKKDKDYVQPNLLYQYPTNPCGDIVVKSDTRSTEEKNAELKAIAVQKKLGTYTPQKHRLITYQIVGFVVAEPYSDSTSNISNYLKNLFAYSNPLSMNATIPVQLYDKLPDDLKVDGITSEQPTSEYARATESLGTHVVAFTSIDQARNFMNNETCPSSDSGCKKLYTADPYGSNYLILDQIGAFFAKIMTYAIPCILLLAIIIIWFTMSRIMADNRRETAIYRAMGAKRHDIATIYIIYTLIIALRIVVVSLVVGVIAAWVINASYGQQLSAIASTSFGVQEDTTPTFSLFDLSSPYLLVVPCIIVIVCLVAVTYPLLRNVRRSPIKDMREE